MSVSDKLVVSEYRNGKNDPITFSSIYTKIM